MGALVAKRRERCDGGWDKALAHVLPEIGRHCTNVSVCSAVGPAGGTGEVLSLA